MTVGDGILVTTNVAGQALTITDGQIQPTGATDLILINNGTGGTTLNVGATIQNNGATLGALTKTGTGVIILSGTNTYTGSTYIGQGVLQATDSVNIATTVTGNTSSGSTTVNVASTAGLTVGQAVFGTNIPLGATISSIGASSVTLNSAATASSAASSQLVSFGTVSASGLGQGLLLLDGGVLGLTSNFTRALGTTYGQFEVPASSGGFADLGASAVTVNFGGDSTPQAFLFGTGLGGVSTQSWGSSGYGSTMILGSTSDTNTVNVVNPLDFGNLSRTFEVDHGSAAIDGELSGVLSGASNVSGLIKTGLGTLLITATETYQGTTVVTAGTLTEGGIGLISSYSPLTVDGPTAVFDLGSNHNNTVSTVILDGGGAITGTGSSTLTSPYLDLRSGSITANLAGAATPLIKSTTGTITLSGTDTFTGPTNVSGGALVLAGAAALPIGTNLNVAAGASVVANNLGSSFGLSVAALTDSGKLNLNNNGLVIHTGTIATITTLVASGFNSGTWNGSTGIVSTTAATNSTHLTALGVIINDTGANTNASTGTRIYGSLEGATTVDGDILVKYTYYGDANLSGGVDGSDYSLIDNGYLNNLTGWYNGDFNYDGVVNGSDYTLIDNAFNSQGAAIAAEIASPSATATAEIAGSGTSAVPEPTALSLLGIGTGGVLGRRRRRGN